MLLTSILILMAIGLATLVLLRQWDHRADRSETDRLIGMHSKEPPAFKLDMIADLPEPARRFFAFAIAEGTPLHRVARLEMHGKFGMGDKAAPGYMPMRAKQVLAAPEGFVWSMSGGAGAMRMSGSDSGTWTRFWVFGLVPVARFGDTADHRRSTFGRYVAEAVFWTPAAVLPGPDVSWTQVSTNVARMIMRKGDLEQAVDLAVAEDGRPLHVVFMRWSDANPDKVHRLQPFGGYLSEFRNFGGFNLPTHVEAGNAFQTGDYFPFFIVDVTRVDFPRPDRQQP